MADSGALRQRRLKAHKEGDHSLCRRVPGGCPDLLAEVAQQQPRRFSAALEELVTGLELTADDPRWIEVAMCRALAPAVDTGSVQAVRQVRDLLAGVTLHRPHGPGDAPDSTDYYLELRRLRRDDIARRRAAGEFADWPGA